MTQVVKLGGGAGHFHQSDFLIGRYAARPPASTTMTDVLHPEYWQNHIGSMKPGMVINVLSDDMALDCDLRVMSVTKTTVKMRVLRVHCEGRKANSEPNPLPSAITVQWGGPQHKWRVVHTGEVVAKGFASEDEAREAALKYGTEITG